jgi:uncharacterized protein YjbI with pentapeptide repeats
MRENMLMSMKVYNLYGKLLFDIKKNFSFGDNNKLKITDVDFREKELKNMFFENIFFEGGNFDSADACNVNIKKVIFEGSWVCEIDLCGAILEDVEFYDVQAYNAKFKSSAILKCSFFGANLSGSDFSDAKLEDVIFTKDNINHKTDLTGVNFTNVDLTKVNFESAIYNNETKFPDKFEPYKCVGLEKVE